MQVLTDPVEAVSDVIDHMVERKSATGDEGRELPISEFAVPAQAGLLLESAAADVAPRISIEVGCASGLSTLYICRGRMKAGDLPPRSCHVIDPHQGYSANIGLHAIRRAGIEKAIQFHAAPSHDALPDMLRSGIRAQFAFIDGMHLFDTLMNDLYYCDLLLDVGGVLAVHDMWMPALQHVVSFWLANRAYRIEAIHAGRLKPEPCESVKRGCGALDKASPFFQIHLAPFVDWSVLFVRKMDDDRRPWNHFQDYCGG